VASSTFDGTFDPMRYIASVVANAVEFSDLHETILEIEWDLKNYVLAEMSAGQALDDMLTVTGTTDCAWAATCKEYTERMWPNTGSTVLEALSRLVVWWKEGHTGFLAARSAYDGDFAVDISPTVQPKIHIKVQGTKNPTIKVTQQLA